MTKEECLPLGVADHIARPAWQIEMGCKGKVYRIHRLKSEASYRRNLWRLSIEKEALLNLREELFAKNAAKAI